VNAPAASLRSTGAWWWPWATGAVVSLYLLTRLPHLTRLPVFLDEAMHLDWAFRTAATGQLVGHTDGGRYLPIWAYAVAATRAADPLRAARLCSVASGLAALLGLAWLGRLLGSPQAGLLAAFLYVASPFALLYDRMALVDSLLSALVVYALAFAVLWAATSTRGWAIGLGAVLGAAGLTKLSGLLLFALPVIIAFSSRTSRRARLRRQLAWVYGVAFALLLPLYLDVAGTGRFFAENLWVLRSGADGSSFVGRNAHLAVAWLLAYLTPLGAVVVALAAVASPRQPDRADVLLLSVGLGWCVFFVLVGGRYWFPRYVLPALPPLLLLVGRRAWRLGRAAAWLVAGLLTLAWFRFDAALIADPVHAPLPPVERSQYIYDWPSGYGLAEICTRLQQAAERDPVIVLRDQSSTPLKEGLDLLLRGRHARMEIVDAPVKAGNFMDSIEQLIRGGRPVLFAIDEATDRQMVLSLDGRRAVGPWAEVAKPDGVRQVAVYAVAGPSEGVVPAASEDDLPGLEEHVRRDAPSAALETRVGWTLGRLDRWGEAEAAFRRGLALDRTVAAAQNGLGVSLWLQGRRDEALWSLAEGLRLEPADLRAGFNLNVARNAVQRGR
jgi:tetratricopeptide (TPR) repeat protein